MLRTFVAPKNPVGAALAAARSRARICRPVFLLALLLSARLFADADGEEEIAVIDLGFDSAGGYETVVRERAAAPLSPSSRVIKASEFQGKFSDLQSVLETVSGVDIRAMGGHGQYAESSIRGGAAVGARVYLDGVLLNSASGGAVDLSKIPLDKIREIRVTKSTSGLRQMGAGMGGVIELFTDAGGGAERRITGVNFEAGSFGHVKAGMTVRTSGAPPPSKSSARPAASATRIRQQFNVEMSSSDNNYPFTHDNGTVIPTLRDPDPTWDDTLLYKGNNYYRSVDAAYSASVDISGSHSLTQRISASAFEQGLFAYHYKNDQSGTTGGRTVMYGADYQGVLTPRLAVGGEASGVYRGSGIRDPDGRFFAGAAGRELESGAYTADLAADARYAVTEKFHVAGIMGTRFQRYSQRDKLLGGSPEMFRQEYRAGAEAAFAVPARDNAGAGENNITVESALRAVYKYEIDTVTPGFDYWLTEGKTHAAGYPVLEASVRANLRPVTLQLSAAASKRSPTFFERFGWSSGFISTPDLKEETRVEADAGASLDMGQWSAAASVFAGRVSDKIKSIPHSRGFVKVMNFADTRFYGAEFDAASRFLRMMTVELNAAYLNSKVVDAPTPGWAGKTEPFIPAFSGFLKTEIDIQKFTAGHGVRYESECYLSIANTIKRPPQTELSAWASYTVKDFLTLRYKVDNYLNTATFDFLDNPKPRRNHVVSMLLTL